MRAADNAAGDGVKRNSSSVTAHLLLRARVRSLSIYLSSSFHRYLKLLREITDTNSFFYSSYGYELTSSLQRFDATACAPIESSNSAGGAAAAPVVGGASGGGWGGGG